MIDPVSALPEFEAFGLASGAALVCGALSILFSPLTAGAAALTALGLASWVSLVRRRGTMSRDGSRRARTLALTILGAAAVTFLIAPAPLAPARGLLLAAGLLPLIVLERRCSARRVPVFLGR